MVMEVLSKLASHPIFAEITAIMTESPEKLLGCLVVGSITIGVSVLLIEDFVVWVCRSLLNLVTFSISSLMDKIKENREVKNESYKDFIKDDN